MQGSSRDYTTLEGNIKSESREFCHNQVKSNQHSQTFLALIVRIGVHYVTLAMLGN